MTDSLRENNSRSGRHAGDCSAVDQGRSGDLAQSQLFELLARDFLGSNKLIRFQARGRSMSPAIRDGEIVHVKPVVPDRLQPGDIVLVKGEAGFRLHRLVASDRANNVFICRGDCAQENDPRLNGEQILGVAQAKEVRIGRRAVAASFGGVAGWALRCAARVFAIEGKLWNKSVQSEKAATSTRTRTALIGLLLVLTTALVHAQVTVDATTSRARERTGAGTVTNNFNHTTAAGTNMLLIVGVSMNITNAPATAVTSITYGGTNLTLLGAHNDSGTTRRVEMWYLLKPASGTNAVDVSVNIPTAGATVGIVAGATTFTGVDQTVPLGSFVSADGAGGAYSDLDVPSVVNGMILDTLATGGTQTVTVPGPQVSQWNLATTNGGGTSNDPPDVTATGSSRTGAPSVPLSETFSGASNWSLGAISINPSSADIGVTTSVSAVALGQSSTYTITVTNNGPSAANNVTLRDTLAASGLTLNSVTPSSGTTCTGTGPINCTLPTPFASGAVATVTVVVTASAAGFYPNTASITDSGTPPDPNTGNNSYVALAPVVSVVCSTATLGAAATPLSGVLNTYYPGTANVAAGAAAIPVGTPTGAANAIVAGSLLLVIQMQNASINTSNSVAYGNGSTGAGFTTINNAGNYEFVKAIGPVSAGFVSISGAGAGGGLVFGYTASGVTVNTGQSTYQVVLVPQYTTATLGAATASPWNGSTGGILALDIAGQLNLGGATVSVDGMGFRGGAGLQLGGGGGASTDFQQPAPATYTPAGNPPPSTTTQVGWDAAKGEGVAGTPAYVQSGGTFLATGTSYPSGTTGVDGSMGRGAPANAGGGGTDADPQPAPPAGNDQNDGGGGGGNGGSGGFGGDSWNTNLSNGGEGGAAFPATIDRIAMGGGGGAGTRNNSNPDLQASGAAAGGGIIFIRADSFTGTATLSANGAAAYNATQNDAGGGGGAGGTIAALAANGGESGLTLSVNGGTGGNAWESEAFALTQRHGPGGGGGGGVVFVSASPAGVSVSGAANGLTLNTPAVAYGSTPGNAGSSVTNAKLSQVTGIQSAALCTPDMTLGKSHAGNFTRGSAASYQIPVSNVSPYGASVGVVTINDTLPIGLTPASATGTGWTCSVSGQTVSCTRSDSLAALGTYPSITLNAAVIPSAPATVTNIATVAGGGEANLLNDTATDVANVVSSADLSVTDSGTPNPVPAGSNITYTQIVTNNGPSAADNAILVAPIPANTTFVSMAVPAGWSCATPAVGSTGSAVCTDIGMPALTAATFTLVVKVNATVTNGTVISDTTSVSSATTDPNSANNTATVNTLVGTSGPDLTVTNVASPNPVQAGNNITYTQVVTNTGSSAATTATFNETTPTNTTFVPTITAPAGWTCTAFPPQCTNPSVAAGVSGTFTVVYKVNAGTASGVTITDTATVNAANQSFGANSATATDIVATAAQADLALTTAASPPSVFSGNNITYTQAITNNGPAPATSLSFTEATPTNTTFASVSAPAGWTCTSPAVGSTGTVNCTAASLAVGTEADIVVAVNVPPSTAAGTITANSSVTASTSDPNSANNSTTVATPVTVACDLAVTNSGTPNPVAAGANITYTQVVTNNGPSNCASGTLNEATPANTTFVSVAVVNSGGGTWTCPNSAPVACTSASVAPGSTGTITAIYKVSAGAAGGTIITDTATVATTSRDTSLFNNTATVQIAVASGTQADLSVTNVGSPNPVSAGGNITYSQSVTNAGPAAATTVSFTDPIPANTAVVSLTGPAGWTCTTGTNPPSCTIPSLAANTTANFTFVVTVNANTTSGTAITETDSVTSAVGDPNPANNSATVTTQVTDSADLSVTNSASPVPVIAGNNITYSQTVSNAGPSTATSVTVTESLPANTTAVSLAGPAGWTCSLLTCTNPSLVSGSPATITFVVKVTAGTAAGTAINDTVNVSSAVGDPNPANNSATAADVVALGTQADLVTTNVASPTSVAAGGNVTYTQAVTNNGPSAATGATFSETTPPNMTFQSIIPPAGWTCGTLPTVGSTGTISCTDGSNLAVNGSAAFTVTLQVTSATPSGTNITDTVTATASNIVPSLATNSASATIVVANANSADMKITKSANQNPVNEGTLLTYSLVVTNNGPASATNVTVMDTLPSTMTYDSAAATPQGSCSEANGIVTCLLGTMANAAIVTITIVTTPSAPGAVTNTATVKADQTDPNQANNTATQVETITAPTAIALQAFSAHSGNDKNGANRVILTWKTGGEAHNLGFNVYREVRGNRVRLNSSLIAGSALLMSGALPKHAGRSYGWVDPSAPTPGASYWLEDVDVNGTRTMHGPVAAESGIRPDSDATVAETRVFSQLSQSRATPAEGSHIVEAKCKGGAGTAARLQKQFELAAHPAVKIYVRHEGWYRVTQADLVKAGLEADVDPSRLHLYAEAVEQPMQITGASQGPRGFGPNAAIKFYGTAIDTQFSGTRVYWLVAEDGRGARIPQLQGSSGSNQPPPSFPATVELSQHTTYFAALLTNNGQNFFGALVSPAPVEQTLSVLHLDSTSAQNSQLDVILQGVIINFPHDVQVAVNGTPVGNVTFIGQNKGELQVDLPAGLLQEGNNTVTLTAQNGDYDTSLVQSIRITYPHQYVADSDILNFSGRAGEELKVSGFTSAPTVLDVTDADHPMQLTPQVTSISGTFDIAFQIPWTTSGSTLGTHTLIALATDRVASPAGVLANHPSLWHVAQAGADIAMVTYGEFEGALDRLVRAHEAEGKTSVVVRVGDIYDEFNFGERSPFAIHSFLETAKAKWKKAPSYLLLNGRASFDPRDYLGVGHTDLVPTRILPIGGLMTASDDWFSDFNNSDMPTMATGRLPVATLDDDETVVAKIVDYEGKATRGPWTSRALMVSDKDDTESFSQDSKWVQSRLPSSIKATNILVGVAETTETRQQIVEAINSGQLLVNYLGHGSEEQWSGSDVFDTEAVSSLTNGSHLPVFLIMDCLNGFLQDIYAEPLGVTLLLAPNGGAVAVLASSGLNQPAPQTNLDRMVVQNAIGSTNTLGDAIVNAKSNIGDTGVRRTFILFGDPAMHIKQP